MTIVTTKEVACDGCGISADCAMPAAYEARALAERNGWTRRRNRDLCPNCTGREDANQ